MMLFSVLCNGAGVFSQYHKLQIFHEFACASDRSASRVSVANIVIHGAESASIMPNYEMRKKIERFLNGKSSDF